MKKVWLVIGIIGVMVSVCASGVFAEDQGSSEGATEAVTYYSGNLSEAKNMIIKLGNNGYRLFDHVIAYRDDMRPFIIFELPISQKIRSARIEITAYNDDSTYERAVWFEVDGIGGYIGTSRLGRGATNEVMGWGRLGVKEEKKLVYDLHSIETATTGENGEDVEYNLLKMLKKPGKHIISCWVSTYKDYGPQSWVTVDLILQRNGGKSKDGHKR